MLSILSLVMAVSLRPAEETFLCPTDWLVVDGSCVWYGEGPKGWYEAEVSCRLLGGNLATFATEKTFLSLSSRSPSGKSWTGLIGEGGEWKFSNYESTTMKLNLDKPTSGMHCGAIHNGQLTAASCHEQKSYFCSVGVGSCIWRKHSNTILEFENGNFGSGGISSSVKLDTSTNIIYRDDVEAGIGYWVGPSTFIIDSPSGVSCMYTIKFNQGFVMSGCNGQLTRSNWITKSNVITSYCSLIPEPTPTTPGIWSTPQPTPAPTKAPIPVTAKPGSDLRSWSPAPLAAIESNTDDYSIPTWAWPLAIIAVAAASAVAAVGAVNRKKKKGSVSISSEESVHAMIPISAEGAAAAKAAGMDCTSADCEICKKFNETTARQRLLAVHQALMRELSMPLVVSGTRCDHVGGEHIHVFNVENDFDSHTLGALSTVYSRTKPRLPRNTRIHIVHKKERQNIEHGHVDFAGDHAYIADAYY